MATGYNKPCRRSCLVARPPAARSSTTYQIAQVKGKNSPLTHTKRQPWPRRRAPEAVTDAIASQAAADRPNVKLPKVPTPVSYRRRGRAAPERFGQGQPPMRPIFGLTTAFIACPYTTPTLA
jgi:hypothetical protein